MTKTLLISALALGMTLTASSAFAQRGMSTFSGKASVINFSSAIKNRSAGQRCTGTICGEPEAQSEAPVAKKRTPVKLRSKFRSRCSATFCALR